MDAITIGFACYQTMILIIGFYTARITNNLKDFALGGQRLGPTVIVFAEIVTPRLSAFVIAGLAVIIVSKMKK